MRTTLEASTDIPNKEDQPKSDVAAAAAADDKKTEPEEVIPTGCLKDLIGQDDILAKIFGLLYWNDLITKVYPVCRDFYRLIFQRQECFANQNITLDMSTSDRYSKFDSSEKKSTERQEKMAQIEARYGVSVDDQHNLLHRVRRRQRRKPQRAPFFASMRNMSGFGEEAADGVEFEDSNGENGDGAKYKQTADLEEQILLELYSTPQQQDPPIPKDKRLDMEKVISKGWETFGIFDEAYLANLKKIDELEKELHAAGLLPFNHMISNYGSQLSMWNEHYPYHDVLYDPEAVDGKGRKIASGDDDDIEVDFDDYDSKESYVNYVRLSLYGEEYWNRGFNAQVAQYYKLEWERRQREEQWFQLTLANKVCSVISDVSLSYTSREFNLRELQNPIIQWLCEKRKKTATATEARNILPSNLDFDQQDDEDDAEKSGDEGDDDIDEDLAGGYAEMGDDMDAGEDENEDDQDGDADDLEECDFDDLVFSFRGKNDLVAYLEKVSRRRYNNYNNQNQNNNNNDVKLVIARDDSVCSLEKLEHWLFHPTDFYTLSLELINVCAHAGNLKTLYLSSIEPDPKLVKGILFQLPNLESLSLYFERLKTREFAMKQYKKLMNIKKESTDTATKRSDEDELLSKLDPNDPMHQWDIANKEEIGKISKKLTKLNVIIYYDYSSQEDQQIEPLLFMWWCVLLVRRYLKELSLTMTNYMMSTSPFSAWVRRYDQETFDNSLIGPIFPELTMFSLQEYGGSSEFLRRIPASDLSILLAEQPALKDLTLNFCHNPSSMLCDIVKMPHLQYNLETFALTLQIETRQLNDTERDEALRNLRLVSNQYSSDERRFKATKRLSVYSGVSIDYNHYRGTPAYDAELQFKRKFQDHITKLVSSCMVSNKTEDISCDGYDSAIANAVWICGKSLKNLSIDAPYETELVAALASVGPQELETLNLGSAEYIRNDETGEYYTKYQDYLEHCNHAYFSSLKTVFYKCRKLCSLNLVSTNVIRDEDDLMLANILKTDVRAMAKGGKLRAYAEAMKQLVDDGILVLPFETPEEINKREESLGVKKTKEQQEEEASKRPAMYYFDSINATDIDAMSIEELRQLQPYLTHICNVSLSRTITHNTIMKVAECMPNIAYVSSGMDYLSLIDSFTFVFANHKLPKLESFGVARTWNYYVYDQQYKQMLQKQEEREIKYWRHILSKGPKKTLLKYRQGISMSDYDFSSYMPFALNCLFKLSYLKDHTSQPFYMERNEAVQCKRLIKKAYDDKYSKAASKMKRADRKLLKQKYLKLIEKKVKIRVLKELLEFEEKDIKTRDELIGELEKDVSEEWAKDADLIEKVADRVLKLKTFVNPQKSAYDSDDDRGLWYARFAHV